MYVNGSKEIQKSISHFYCYAGTADFIQLWLMNAGSHGIWVHSCTALLWTAITMIPAFSKFLKKWNILQLEFSNFNYKNCHFSNFSQFLEKSQFWLGTLQPPSRLQLEFSNFSCKNCNFSSFFFAIFGEIAEIAVLTGNPSTFFSLYHLSVMLAKTAISPIFRNFCYCVQTWTYLKKGDYSNEDNVLPQRFLFDDLNYSLRQICTLSPPPLPSKSRTGKWRVLAFARLHPWFGEGRGGDGSLLFHFILSKIVAPSAAGITVLFLRIVGTTGQRTGHDFYPLKIFHLFGFPSWKSCDPKIIGIKTYLFKNFSQKKCSQKF